MYIYKHVQMEVILYYLPLQRWYTNEDSLHSVCSQLLQVFYLIVNSLMLNVTFKTGGLRIQLT